MKIYNPFTNLVAFNRQTPQRVLLTNILYWSFYILLLVGTSFIAHTFSQLWFRYAYGIGGCLSIYLITFWFLKRNKKSFADVGLRFEPKTLFRFLQGFLLGTLFICALYGAVLVLEDVRFELVKNADIGLFFVACGAIFFNALHEEIAFRSYSLQTLQPSFGLWGSQLVIAVAFGIYHWVNGWGFVGAMLSTGSWALVFGLAAVVSKGIALPTGIHTSVNIGQALIGSKQALWTIAPINEAEKNWQEHAQMTGENVRYVLILISIILFLTIKKQSVSQGGVL